MPQATADLFASPCLQFKGSMVPLTTLELLYFDPEKFSQTLQEKIQQAPNLFKNLPLVLSLDKFADDINNLNLLQIRELCAAQELQLVGIRATEPAQIAAAQAAGLAVLQPSRGRQEAPEDDSQSSLQKASEPQTANPQSGAEATEEVEDPPPGNGVAANRVIRTPIRSGQQVYAPGGDLIIMAPVSAGAEILADGNIHVYGPLRGRALAGVRGNTEAMVFCQSLEAELVSIAGQYKISEDLLGNHWKKPSLLKLEDDRLVIREL